MYKDALLVWLWLLWKWCGHRLIITEIVKGACLDGFMSVCSATWTKVLLLLPTVLVNQVCLWEGVIIQNNCSLNWDPRTAVSTVTDCGPPALIPVPRSVLDRLVYRSCLLSSAQLFCIFPPQRAASGPSFKAPAPAAGQRAFRDFSLLAGDFRL